MQTETELWLLQIKYMLNYFQVETKAVYEKITIYPATTPAPNMTWNSTVTMGMNDTTMAMTTAGPKVIGERSYLNIHTDQVHVRSLYNS
jgi:hypothetical protein